MSARDLRHINRENRRNVLQLDLNQMPPLEEVIGFYQYEGADHVRVPPPPPPVAVDVEAIDDDDVVISSPRSFHEARAKARRNHGITADQDHHVQQVERAPRLSPNNNRKRRRVPTDEDGEQINLEGSENTKNANHSEHSQSMQPPPPKEPSFSCPICMEEIKEPTSTKCGHVFCRICISTAIGEQTKCPICKKKVLLKNTFRIYLPRTC